LATAEFVALLLTVEGENLLLLRIGLEDVKTDLGTEVGVLGLFAQLESDDESVDEVKELSLIPLSLREGERELSSSLSR